MVLLVMHYESFLTAKQTGEKVAEIRELLRDDRKVYEVHKDLHSLEELRREALLQVREICYQKLHKLYNFPLSDPDN